MILLNFGLPIYCAAAFASSSMKVYLSVLIYSAINSFVAGCCLKKVASGLAWRPSVILISASLLSLIGVAAGLLPGFGGISGLLFAIVWFVGLMAVNRLMAAAFRREGIELGWFFWSNRAGKALRLMRREESEETRAVFESMLPQSELG